MFRMQPWYRDQRNNMVEDGDGDIQLQIIPSFSESHPAVFGMTKDTRGVTNQTRYAVIIFWGPKQN